MFTREVLMNLSKGGLKFFSLSSGGLCTPWGPENPMKSIDFTGPGGSLAPIAPPEYDSDV